MLNAHSTHWRGCAHKHSRLSTPAFGHRRPRAAPAAGRRSGAVCRAAAIEAPLGSQAVLDRYRALLHEYRAHKAALGDWLSSFRSRHCGPPQLLDAEATGDPVLLARFQQYLMARKRLLAEIPLLREQLDEAGAGDHHTTSSSNSSGSSSSSHRHHHHHGSVNANQAAPISRSQAVGQFFAAVNYRQQHGARKLAAAEPSTASTSSAVLPTAGDSQLQVTEVLQQRDAAAAAAIVDAAAAPAPAVAASLGQDLSNLAAGSSSPSNSSSISPSSSSSSKADSAAHLLSSVSSQAASSSAGSSRATAAALAALAYKKQKQQQAGPGSSSSSSSSSSSTGPVSRGLAMLQAEAPQLPAGIDAAAAAAGRVVVGVVETAKGDVNAARRNSRALDADVSLEATLQGVPGGLGSSSSATMFAAPIAVQSAAAGSMGTAPSDSTSAASSGSGSPVLVPPPGADASAPVGEVVTARFDVYAGRRRVLAPDAGLDEYFAGLEAAAAAAAAAMEATSPAAQAQQPRDGGASISSSSAANGGGGSKKSDTAGGNKAQQQQQQQAPAKRVQQAEGYGGLLPEIVPLPI